MIAFVRWVPAAFTAMGFDWWEAYRLLVTRYYEGAAGVRPYGYWVWANLACTVLITGLATVAGLRRTGGVLLRRRAGGGRAGSAGTPDVRAEDSRAAEVRAAEVRLAFLVAAGLLTRDARVIERKKAGLKKARKAPQFSKR